MFNYKHYVPILRWKAAEKEALQKIGDDGKKLMTPLVELIMPQSSSYKEGERIKTAPELLAESIAKCSSKFPEIAGEINKYWGGNPIFLDLSLIDHSLRVNGLSQILTSGINLGLSIIPVVCLSTSKEYKQESITYGREQDLGICLRLFSSDIYSSTLKSEIAELLRMYNISESKVDLVVDFQITNEACQMIIDLEKLIPNISNWRSMTFISGTFPKDLMKLSVDLHFIGRSDWMCWKKQILSGGLFRNPAFGDYTIQHPIFFEPTPGANPSASIRYTLPETWMINRGQGLRSPKSAGHAQYPALANLLIKRKEYFGKDFSYGDSYIYEIGSDVNNKKTGNPRTWLRAGINHHISCVISQISNLP